MASRHRPKGVDKLRRRLRRLPDAAKEEIGEVFDRAALDLAQGISAAAPKDEGRLGTAAYARVSNDRLAVYAGYSQKRPGFKRLWKRGGFVSLWQEFGAKQHRPHAFINPAFRERKPAILRNLARAVVSALKKSG